MQTMSGVTAIVKSSPTIFSVILPILVASVSVAADDPLPFVPGS